MRREVNIDLFLQYDAFFVMVLCNGNVILAYLDIYLRVFSMKEGSIEELEHP